MVASPSLPYLPYATAPFSYNPTKIPTPCICSSRKFSFITCSGLPINGSDNRGCRIIKCEGQDNHPKLSEHNPRSGAAIKAPTAPWMSEPLLVKPNEVLDFRKPRTKRDSTFRKYEERRDKALSGKVGGGRGRIAMKQIFKGIEKLQGTRNSEETGTNPDSVKFNFAPGDLWGNEDHEHSAELEESSEESRENLESREFDIPFAGTANGVKSKKWPWESDDKVVIYRVKKEKPVTASELRLDDVLLERLRGEAPLIRKWVKVKKAGVTQAVVDQIHFIWRNSELALLKFDIPLCRNMDRAREITEMKTGGIVIWRNKDFLAIYRGCNYRAGPKYFRDSRHDSNGGSNNASTTMSYKNATNGSGVNSNGSKLDEMINGKDGQQENLQTASLYEREADRLLDGLGPRFVDWWMQKPLPVDADLLPETVPGFTIPFRLCPPFTRSKLTDAELTYMRGQTHALPTHFVLGRNRKLQGLAAAIIKLWGKCHIAKIALKWGVPNTDNELMAFELKNLTGGVLLLRNKFWIILYRGKDFITSEVAKVVSEREMELTRCQLQEEAARLKASETFSITDEHELNPGNVGTLSEFYIFLSQNKDLKDWKNETELQLEAEQETLEKELRHQERKLFILEKKMEKSAKILEKLKASSRFSEKDPDLEIMSKEERECLRQMGLKIDSSLVLGRRGVFDGVVEGMHQHWKHREIVKVITMQKKFSQVMFTAKCLEAESGGILVSVVKLKEGHAIIVYRGKNFKRPKFAAQNLLNKREALSRSLEIQRFGSLKFFASQRQQAICDLKSKLAELSKRIDSRS